MTKKTRILIFLCISIAMASLVFATSCAIQFGGPSPTPGPGPNTALINEAWNKITTNYVVPSKADSATLNAGAIRGMVDSLNDPYSAYFTAHGVKVNYDAPNR